MKLLNKKQEVLDYSKIYEFYGVNFNGAENSKGDLEADCIHPECGKENHLRISKTTGMFRCLKCGIQGNVYGFFTLYHQVWLGETTSAEYKLLAESRGLTSQVLRDAKFAFDSTQERWLVPIGNGSEFLNNLGAFYPNSSKKDRFVIKKSPLLTALPKFYRPFDLKELKDEIYVFEGEWDLLAAKCAFTAAKADREVSLAATGGSTTWTPKMNHLVQGKNCVFFMNNDKGGEAGEKTITKNASGCTYSFVRWTGELDTYKDFRDIWLDVKPKSKAYDHLMELATTSDTSVGSDVDGDEDLSSSSFTTDIETIEPVPSYAQFHSTLDELIYTNDTISKSIDILQAICISIHLPDKPLWGLLFGPASSGKSMLISSFGGTSDWFDYQTKLSSEALISGARGKDVSLIRKLNHKSLFVADLTVILTLPIMVQEKLFGLLREIYDGTVKVPFGNQAPKEFHNFKMNLIAGVTHVIHTLNNSDVGERFLRIDYVGPDFDEDAHMNKAMASQDRWPEIKKALMENTMGYYKQILTGAEGKDFTPVKILEDSAVDQSIKFLGKLVAKVRSKVSKDKTDGLTHRPVSEAPTRLALSFRTLAKSLCWVRQEDEVTPDNYACVQKVAFDTCPGLALEVLLFISSEFKSTRQNISKSINIPMTRVNQIVNDFIQLGVIERVKINNGSGFGRDATTYAVTPSIARSLGGLGFSPKRVNGFKIRPRSTS